MRWLGALSFGMGTALVLVACNTILGNGGQVLDVDAAPAVSPDSGGSSCANDCDGEPVGTVLCSTKDSGISVCVRASNGCPAWRSSACATGTCDPTNPSACAGSCTSPCPQEGATECDGTGARRVCTVTGACLAWGPSEPCPSGQGCFGNACATSCTSDPECSAAGVKICASSGTFRACAEAAPGCVKLGAPQSCPSGEGCSGAGVCSCAGCTTGDGACHPGTTPAACGSSGACKTCPSGNVCSGGACKCTGCTIGGTCYAAGSDRCCGATKIDCTQVSGKCSSNTNCVCAGTSTNCFNGTGMCINCTTCGKTCGSGTCTCP
ncbi:MAG TPA: hypothetical protein VLT33_18990 [Labilithrix sp.]|nr:hypothetical protein [Labilithrix sp.]